MRYQHMIMPHDNQHPHQYALRSAPSPPPCDHLSPSPSAPFHFFLYLHGTLQGHFTFDFREDFDEVVDFARSVKARGIQERRHVTIDMLHSLTDAAITAIRESRLHEPPLALVKSTKRRKVEFLPQVVVDIERCDPERCDPTELQ